MKELFRKYREVLAYLFFGVATNVDTIVEIFDCQNVFCLFFCFQNVLVLDYKISDAICLFLSVLFAFFTNKYWVFASKHESIAGFFKEMGLFYWYRILSFVADMGLMILLIDGIHFSSFWAKMITQVVVVILNYFFSKFFIFKEKEV